MNSSVNETMAMTATVVMTRELIQSDTLTQLLTTAQMNSVTEYDNDNGEVNKIQNLHIKSTLATKQ
jgi:hypothetical protein